MTRPFDKRIQAVLARGTVIPAHPLALTADRRLDERRQRALTRYYIEAGAGGLRSLYTRPSSRSGSATWDCSRQSCGWQLKKWIAPTAGVMSLLSGSEESAAGRRRQCARLNSSPTSASTLRC